jgi:Protein phosphatase 2C
MVAACADGAGSRSRSHEGAAVAVAVAIERARRACPVDGSQGQLLDDPAALARRCMGAARGGVHRLAASSNGPRDLFETTLSLCVETQAGIAFVAIGDGVTCVKRGNALDAPFAPQRGEYANETFFIDEGRRLPQMNLRCYGQSEVDAFCLSSDGLATKATAHAYTGAPYEPFFNDLFAYVGDGGTAVGLEEFLKGLGERDDTTLVVGVRVGA